ncbi:MAG: hybrid sensor histidine kinase/response regulator [Leptospiraceae bacterium]|nr:hybrid sensor histidine kinase/response regulator [Leptospiraceae bacterium]
MKYQEQIFDCKDSDKKTFSSLKYGEEILHFIKQLDKLILKQQEALNQLNLEVDKDEIFDNLYRSNHILYGMAKIYEIPKIEHLLEILDFIFDLARRSKTTEIYSLGYLITLFHQKILDLVAELQHSNTISIDVSDLIEESKNYLLSPLNQWTESPFQEVVSTPVSESQAEKVETAEEPIQPPIQVLNNILTSSTIEIPYDDEPEPLNVPLDKLGMISEFYEENMEILGNFANSLLEIENSDDQTELINSLFRMIHTVKGGARLLNIKKLECLSHSMENLLDLIRQRKLFITSEAVDLLLDCKSALTEMMEETASRGPFSTRIRPYIERLQALINGKSQASSSTSSQAQVPTSPSTPSIIQNNTEKPTSDKDKGKNAESLRVSSEKLDEVLNTASEIFIGRIRFQNEISAIHNFTKSFKSTLDRTSELQKSRILAKMEIHIPEFAEEIKRFIDSGKKHSRSVETLLSNLFSKVVTRIMPENTGMEMSLHEELNLNYLTIVEIQKQLQKNLETLEQLSTRLQNGAMSFRMVPISNLFERFPLQLRDMAKMVGKKIKVNIIGGDTELDKVLINKLADPLLHMLRNSIDHGIEFPEDRAQAGKPETGTITLETYYHGSYAVIEIRDDGKGIDADRILEKSMERGLIQENQQGKITRTEILEMIFLPGFSTNDKVTELSGRGVGMDVVKTAINQLHGTVEIESQIGKGTCFKLKLPLTLAIVKILLVQESSYQFALPILNIVTLITVKRQDIKHIENRLIINYQGQTIPVASLSSILDFPQSRFQNEKIHMVVLNENNRLIGILVDSVLGRQEILIKSLGRFLTKVPFVMGCTILRDSRLVLILDPRQIAEAVKQSDMINKNPIGLPKIERKNRHTILIVDDSFIQRENLKAIFKNTDYDVETAENGFDALKTCRNKTYSAFCVDIMMPLMDGYEFVERLRKIDIYRNTLIFLITSKDIDQLRISNLNITSVFQKPVNGEELISILNDRLQKKVGI